MFKTGEQEAFENRYKDTMGRWLTESLFYETASNQSMAVYTLKPYHLKTKDGRELMSLKQLYIDSADPTEYTFTTTHLGGWAHWQRLLNSVKLRPYFDEWREELEIMLRSQAVRSMMHTAVSEGAKGTTAAKWLADKGWLEKRGRPTVAEKRKELKKQMMIKDEVAEDAERLGLIN